MLILLAGTVCMVSDKKIYAWGLHAGACLHVKNEDFVETLVTERLLYNFSPCFCTCPTRLFTVEIRGETLYRPHKDTLTDSFI